MISSFVVFGQPKNRSVSVSDNMENSHGADFVRVFWQQPINYQDWRESNVSSSKQFFEVR